MRCSFTCTLLAMFALATLALATVAPSFAQEFPVDKTLSNDGFVTVLDGKTLDNWHISTMCGHGNTKRWQLEDGAMTGSQDKPGNGGIILTNAEYGDFEVIVEMKNDYGPDSGLFLRSNEKGQAYQAMIDYHNNGNLMGVYGEGIGGFKGANFTLLETPDKIKEDECKEMKLPIKPEDWGKFWKHGQWNELRARIVGNPPTITTWINKVKFMEYTDNEKRLPDKGHIALQVHGGGDTTKEFVRYRNVRVKDLSKK